MTVLHPDHGSGELLTKTDDTAYVDFKRKGKLEVPLEELKRAPMMLLHNDVDVNTEWADAEPHEDEEPLFGGQATIDLLFNDEHDIGVDVDDQRRRRERRGRPDRRRHDDEGGPDPGGLRAVDQVQARQWDQRSR